MNGAPPWVAVVVFVAAYVVITARDRRITRLGRPGGALAGAFLMVLTAYLDVAGFFGWAAGRVLGWCRGPVPLLHALVWTSGCLSAILVNDTVCLLLTPLMLVSCRKAGYPLTPYLFAICMGANIGSVATLGGNL